MNNILILASTSPFRKKQLTDLGYSFETDKPTIEERELEKSYHGKLPCLPVFLARKKAESVAKKYPEQVVIGSDQMLIFKGENFHKPNTLDEVVERLMHMQGETHELHTGLCTTFQGVSKTTTTVARMTMKSLSENEARAYAELDQPMGCAGGYKFEQNGHDLFTKIETSDESSIIGLPCLSLVSMLNDWGISRL